MIKSSGTVLPLSAVQEALQRIDARLGAFPEFEKCQDVEATESPLVLDIAQGAYIRLSLRTAIKSLTFANWRPFPLVTRVTLEIRGNGLDFDFGFARWTQPPTLAPGIAIFGLVSPDGGFNVYGRQVAQYLGEVNLAAGAVVLGTPALTVHE